MSELYFLTGLTILLTGILWWGCGSLAKERWQMLAVVPLHKHTDDDWHGLNLTYYGFFIATSQLLAFLLLLILLGSLHISPAAALLAILVLLAACLPASRIMAIMVEKKHHTFTIGGASFVGILLAPWSILLSSHLFSSWGAPVYLPLIPTLAALSICYTLGEGLGRLGCISYGCCYGKPVCECSAKAQRVFRKVHLTFTGPTKKAVYEGQFAGQSLVPVQAITAAIYSIVTVACTWLFMEGRYGLALGGSILISQGWRVISETLRADFRGFGAISAYQKMGVAAMVYVAGVLFCAPPHRNTLPSLEHGFDLLWHPGVILGLQALWLVFFFFFGKSSVTTATVTFAVRSERV